MDTWIAYKVFEKGQTVPLIAVYETESIMKQSFLPHSTTRILHILFFAQVIILTNFQQLLVSSYLIDLTVEREAFQIASHPQQQIIQPVENYVPYRPTLKLMSKTQKRSSLMEQKVNSHVMKREITLRPDIPAHYIQPDKAADIQPINSDTSELRSDQKLPEYKFNKDVSDRKIVRVQTDGEQDSKQAQIVYFQQVGDEGKNVDTNAQTYKPYDNLVSNNNVNDPKYVGEIEVVEQIGQEALIDVENVLQQSKTEEIDDEIMTSIINRCYNNERQFIVSDYGVQKFHTYSHCYSNEDHYTKTVRFDIDKFNVFEQGSLNGKIELSDNEINEIRNKINDDLKIQHPFSKHDGCSIEPHEKGRMIIEGLLIEGKVLISEDLISSCEDIPSINIIKDEVLQIKFPVFFSNICLIGNNYCPSESDNLALYSLIDN